MGGLAWAARVPALGVAAAARMLHWGVLLVSETSAVKTYVPPTGREAGRVIILTAR